jgi:hypothetical protein
MCAVVRLRALMARQAARLITYPPIGPSNDGRRHGRGTYLFPLLTEIIIILGCRMRSVNSTILFLTHYYA